MDLLRSLLFVPADRPRFIEKARDLPVDGILLDLEDGVSASAKGAARAAARAVIPSLGAPVWVRVNSRESGEQDADLAALGRLAGLVGLMLPKVESAEAIRDVAARAADHHVVGALAEPVPLIAQIESALGVLQTYEIATAHPTVASVCLGGAQGGDLQTDLGAGWSSDGPELMYARQHVLLAARAAGVAWPLDGVFAGIRDAVGFEADTELSRRLGYRGRTVIHPDQIAAANRLYQPTDAELTAARAVVAAADQAEKDGLGTTVVDGRLVDIAMVRHARRVLATVVSADDGQSTSR